ncbi:hypothetical protein Aasi_1558 [Candidatus Amoebophilus asiaticus 5a2]|uniref:ribose-phosphate diphosphokinase n=1 Tax=Amoebophilus asiaticus (strain 5a2) TaxID=452471 RepID=C3L4H7_AMOA5|nr:ribose-phosphate diphosphokinase [Candidatus Amoebophilus asiaticus]ACP20895.1 hypothetical protein Aasi_1558 [Candidatus Amoebophilus asiaticus 5a2]
MLSPSVFFFAGTASQELGKSIAELANKLLGKWELQRFSDGEIRPILQENINGAMVVLIQSTYTPVDHLMELLLMIDAARNAGARKVVVVLPYLGYMRQDKVHQAGESYGAALVTKLLFAAGADQLIICEPHTSNLHLYFSGIIKEVSSYEIFKRYLETLQLKNVCFVAPDAGALAAARLYAQFFNANLVACHKIRQAPNKVASIQVTGTVKNTHAIIIDDIIDTGHTLYAVAQELRSQGAYSVYALCTHPIFSGYAYDYLLSSVLDKIIVTNTIPIKKQHVKIKVLDIATCILPFIEKVVLED